MQKVRVFDCCYENQKSNNLEIKDQDHQIFLGRLFCTFRSFFFFFFFFSAVNTRIRILIKGKHSQKKRISDVQDIYKLKILLQVLSKPMKKWESYWSF